MFIFGSSADMIWFLERWISNEYFRFIIYSRIRDMRMARRSWDNFLVWLSRVLICDGFVEKFNSCQDMLDSEFLLDLLNQLGCPLISFAIGLAVDNIIAITVFHYSWIFTTSSHQPVSVNCDENKQTNFERLKETAWCEINILEMAGHWLSALILTSVTL